MKVLVFDQLHHKNRIGLELLFRHMQVEYVFTTDDSKIIDPSFDIIYSPANAIDSSKYPLQKFIFGPHFSIFPNHKLTAIKNTHKNSIYIQPSEWCVEKWKERGVTNVLPITYFPFPVDVERFSPEMMNKKEKVFIYFKRRKPDELYFIKSFLQHRGFEFAVFDYVARYDEKHYLEYLQQAKFGIILGAHESQGFAIQEALSCNVPLIVWNVRSMNQEVGMNYTNIKATSIGYWDSRCGEYFHDYHELEETFRIFMDKLETTETYQPREFIMEHVSVEPCAKRFMELFS
jgi:hypothetical protein